MLTAAHRIMTAKKANTKGQEPIMLRILSADRSPRVSWSPERTPGCLCQRFCQPAVAIVFDGRAHRPIGVGSQLNLPTDERRTSRPGRWAGDQATPVRSAVGQHVMMSDECWLLWRQTKRND